MPRPNRRRNELPAIGARFSPEERAELDRKAIALGLNRSGVIRLGVDRLDVHRVLAELERDRALTEAWASEDA